LHKRGIKEVAHDCIVIVRLLVFMSEWEVKNRVIPMMSITKVQSPGFAGKGGGRVVIFLVRKRKAELVVKLPEEGGGRPEKILKGRGRDSNLEDLMDTVGSLIFLVNCCSVASVY
jgi:hypothetical protein